KAVLSGHLWMHNTTSEGLRVNAVTEHVCGIIGLFPVHLRVNAIAGSIRQDFKCFIEQLLFWAQTLAARFQPGSLLDHNLEEILVARINVDSASQLNPLQPWQGAARINPKGVNDLWNAPG